MAFNYSEAFSRTLGWISPEEQAILRRSKVAIAGLGGVGGSHLLTLTRLGIGAFSISDLDTFELANFNRQAGASAPHLGRPKIEVLAELARDINPEVSIDLFPTGIDAHNVGQFLTGVDVYVDGLDYFALKARQQVFAYCDRYQIPGVTAAPLGMGAAMLTFMPGKMSFEDYFCLAEVPEAEQLVRFLVGLAPAMLQRHYLVYPAAVDFAARKGPSTPMACELCAGMAATQVLKILLGRGGIRAAPWGVHFDAYQHRLKQTWRPWGNRNPLQKLAIALARRILNNAQTQKH